MLGRRGAAVLLFAIALLPVIPGRAEGSVARGLSLLELARASESVVVGTALQAESRWELVGGKKRIVTYTRVRVDQTLAGSAGDSELAVRTLGGTVGKIGQVVHGEAHLFLNEPAVLFVRSATDGATVVTAMSQGHYPVRTDAAGARRLARSPRSFELIGKASAAKQLSGRTVPEARSLVQKAWNAR